MEKILAVEKRKKARELHKKGWSIRKIAKNLIAGRDNVSRWIKMNDDEVEVDRRGWKKGRTRKYTQETKDHIKKIRRKLEKEDSYWLVFE